MTIAESTEINDVLEQVRTWTPQMKAALARKVLETIEAPLISTPPKTMRLDQVMGLLKTDNPPPNEAECRRIVEEERLRGIA